MRITPSILDEPFGLGGSTHDNDVSSSEASADVIAACLSAGGDEGSSGRIVTPLDPESPQSELAIAQARRMLQFVDESRRLFPDMRDLADHPGWEMLLHIFIARHERRSVTTLDMCDRTGCWRPLTIRYVELLFERGLIDREPHPDDPHAGGLSLTPETEVRFLQLLCGFARGWPESPRG